MMSKIEWTGSTWNPLIGCSVVERALTVPLQTRKPTTWFVNSMADLFHESVPDEWIDRVFAVMALCPQHTFQVLTKRSGRMRAYMNDTSQRRSDGLGSAVVAIDRTVPLETLRWPLPNVWLGVSAEDQVRADERVPDLLATPAAIRFVSAEPLLGPIDFERLDDGLRDGTRLHFDAMTGLADDGHDTISGIFGNPDPRVDWIIVGGESGPGARPMHPDWARSIRDQCAAAGVPFFFKQWGAWQTVYDRDRDDPDWRQCPKAVHPGERYVNLAGGHGFHGDRVVFARNVGKKAAGRLLDGVEHNAMPATTAPSMSNRSTPQQEMAQ